MIFSLNTAMKMPVSNVKTNDIEVSYSWGNYDALLKWLVANNKRQIDNFLSNNSKGKYPLIWLTDEWVSKKNTPGYKFTDVTFYIAINSKVELLNENREDNFKTLYDISNQFINELKKYGKIAENSIEYEEKANLTLVKKTDKTQAIDIWDAVILKMDYLVFTHCLKQMCSL